MIYRNVPIITISESSKEGIKKLGLGRGGIDIVNPGVDAKALKNQKTPNPTFTYVGRLKPYKKVENAVLAFRDVIDTYPDAKLIIAGTGESAGSLTSLISELGLQGSISLLGYIEEKEKYRLFSRSWAAIQPSTAEGWGITVMEAAAVGTPTIASDVAGLRDSVVNKETGLLVKPDDVSSMAKAIKKMIRYPRMRRRLSLNAYENSKNYGWNEKARYFIQVIQSKVEDRSTVINPKLATQS